MRFLAGLVATAAAVTSATAADLTVIVPPPVLVHRPLLAPVHALPACTEPNVLETISEKFGDQDMNILHRGIAIAAIDNIRQTAVTDGPSLVDRRYCTARAWLTDGRTSEVVFLIEGPMLGKYSFGYNVESCLPAFDPYRVYDGNCRAIRAS